MRRLRLLRTFCRGLGVVQTWRDAESSLRPGHLSKTQSGTGLPQSIREPTRLWRRHGFGHDQTKYVVEHVRRELALMPRTRRSRSVDCLDPFEIERLIQAAYRTRSRRGLMIRTLFLNRRAGQ